MIARIQRRVRSWTAAIETFGFSSYLYADLRGPPPLLIQVGSAETLLDDATRRCQTKFPSRL